MSPPEPRMRRRWWWVAQVALSALVLGALVRSVDPDELRALPGRIRWSLLLLALLIKGAALLVHELRVWLVLEEPRPSLAAVARIGLAAGVVNLVLPARAGDLVNVALLRRRCGVGLGSAAAAMGLVAFLEAAVFGVLLLVGLSLGAAEWRRLLGAAEHGRAMQVVGLVTAGGLLAAAVVARIGRRMARDPTPAPRGPGLRGLIREATSRADAALGSLRGVATHVGAALVQVVGVLLSFALALPAVGVDVPSPFFVAAGVLALTALSAVALPPSFGAGPAAASLAVLSMVGATHADALAYATAWWLLSQVPGVLLGLPAMWTLGFRLADTRAVTASLEPPPTS